MSMREDFADFSQPVPVPSSNTNTVPEQLSLPNTAAPPKPRDDNKRPYIIASSMEDRVMADWENYVRQLKNAEVLDAPSRDTFINDVVNHVADRPIPLLGPRTASQPEPPPEPKTFWKGILGKNKGTMNHRGEIQE